MNAKVILICLMAVVATNAYGSGAPDEACSNMIPQHGVAPQSSDAPYKVTFSKNQIFAGDKIDVTIRGDKDEFAITGFMIQARVKEDQLKKEPVGKWFVDKNSAYGQTLNCVGGVSNTVTHKTIDPRGAKSVTFEWESTKDKGDVQFLATVVFNHTNFWVGVKSEKLTIK